MNDVRKELNSHSSGGHDSFSSPVLHTAALSLPRKAGASRDDDEGLLLKTIEGAALHWVQ